MLRHLVLWRGFIFPATRPTGRSSGDAVHTMNEWASYRRALARTIPFRPTYS